MQERITSTRKGSITSVQAVYVPADDLTDPAPATTFSHLDATTVLDRKITELGIYPAVDPLASTSRILDPHIVGQEHYDVAQQDVYKRQTVGRADHTFSFAAFEYDPDELVFIRRAKAEMERLQATTGLKMCIRDRDRRNPCRRFRFQCNGR